MRVHDIIRTDVLRVATIRLDADEKTPRHYHNGLREQVVCISGSIKLQFGELDEHIVLSPGQSHQVPERIVHHLVNLNGEPSAFLLIQQGAYDFVPVSG